MSCCFVQLAGNPRTQLGQLRTGGSISNFQSNFKSCEALVLWCTAQQDCQVSSAATWHCCATPIMASRGAPGTLCSPGSPMGRAMSIWVLLPTISSLKCLTLTRLQRPDVAGGGRPVLRVPQTRQIIGRALAHRSVGSVWPAVARVCIPSRAMRQTFRQLLSVARRLARAYRLAGDLTT